VQRPCDAVVALAGDLPPDVAPVASSIPKVLIGRGSEDKWYTAEKAAADINLLRGAGVSVVEHVFDAGHVWDESFILRSGTLIDELLSL
jgi:predicted esterase